MSILDWFRKRHEEVEESTFEPVEEEIYIDGVKQEAEHENDT